MLEKEAPNLKMARVDCTVEKKLCKKYKVTGYPTMWLFHDYENVKQYKGDRTAEAIKDFIIERSK